MATMNISLPDIMKNWVENQIKSGLYGNASDYVRDLIRRDQKEREQINALQNAINQGIESGAYPTTRNIGFNIKLGF